MPVGVVDTADTAVAAVETSSKEARAEEALILNMFDAVTGLPPSWTEQYWVSSALRSSSPGMAFSEEIAPRDDEHSDGNESGNVGEETDIGGNTDGPKRFSWTGVFCVICAEHNGGSFRHVGAVASVSRPINQLLGACDACASVRVLLGGSTTAVQRETPKHSQIAWPYYRMTTCSACSQAQADLEVPAADTQGRSQTVESQGRVERGDRDEQEEKWPGGAGQPKRSKGQEPRRRQLRLRQTPAKPQPQQQRRRQQHQHPREPLETSTPRRARGRLQTVRAEFEVGAHRSVPWCCRMRYPPSMPCGSGTDGVRIACSVCPPSMQRVTSQYQMYMYM